MKYVLQEDPNLTKSFILPDYFDGPVKSIDVVLERLEKTDPEKAKQFAAKKEIFAKMLAGYLARQARNREMGCRSMGCPNAHRGGRTDGLQGVRPARKLESVGSQSTRRRGRAGGRPTGSEHKARRGKQLFCRCHCGLKHAIGKEAFKRLLTDENLRVVAVQ